MRVWVVEYRDWRGRWWPVPQGAFSRTRAEARTHHYNTTLYPKRVVQYVRKERS